MSQGELLDTVREAVKGMVVEGTRIAVQMKTGRARKHGEKRVSIKLTDPYRRNPPSRPGKTGKAKEYIVRVHQEFLSEDDGMTTYLKAKIRTSPAAILLRS